MAGKRKPVKTAKSAKRAEVTTKAAASSKKTAARPAARPAARAAGGLVVVESPTKARTIGKYLGAGYSVKATVGHVRDLPQRELGVDVDKGFAPKYVTIRGKGKALADLKRAAKTASALRP